MNPSEETLVDLIARRTPRSGATVASIASDLLPPLDVVCLFVAAALSTALYTHGLVGSPIATSEFAHAPWVAAVLAPFILYDKQFGAVASRGRAQAFVRPFAARFAMFGAVILMLGVVTQTLDRFPSGWLVLWFTISLMFTLLSRALVAKAVRMAQQRGTGEVIAVVGAGPLADRLVEALRQSRPDGIELLGVFDDRFARTGQNCIAPVGNVAQLIETAKARKIDWILLALPCTAERRLLAMVHRLTPLSVPIGLCPQHVGSTLPYRVVDYAADSIPVSLLADRPIKRWNALVKSAEDFLLAALLTLLLSPLLAIVAIAIKLDSPGPVIFKQRRHAVNNREFQIYKFRTMRWTAPDPNAVLRQTARHDPRVTRIGAFLRASSLDELPQLFNVLLGQMSLVGPRPHAVDMRTEDQLGTEVSERYAHRHRVKPGITGWSQVNGARGATDTKAQLQRRVELDLHYIDNWSLLLDIKILVLTAREVFRQNAY